MKIKNQPSLAENAYEKIKADIITCKLGPGEQIVQGQLALQYQFGLTPVREALQRLAQEGFVHPIPRYGYIVSPVTISDVHQIYEARLVVEIATIRLASQRGTDEQLAGILDIANFTYTYGDRLSYTEFLNHNADFHKKVALISGNLRLTNLLSIVLEELTRLMHLGLDIQDRAEDMRAVHISLAKALIERNMEYAVDISRKEIEDSRKMVLDAISRHMSKENPTLFGQPVEINKIEI